MSRIVPKLVRMIASKAARPIGLRTLPLLVLVGVGLMLGACSKCSVPTWQHSNWGMGPLSCHDEPALQ